MKNQNTVPPEPLNRNHTTSPPLAAARVGGARVRFTKTLPFLYRFQRGFTKTLPKLYRLGENHPFPILFPPENGGRGVRLLSLNQNRKIGHSSTEGRCERSSAQPKVPPALDRARGQRASQFGLLDLDSSPIPRFAA